MSRTEPLLVANCSGYWGDRLTAAREMLEGGPVDVLTGDYLAELTMLILWKTRQRRPGEGYARTFLTQMQDVLGTCLDRGVKVVANAGGLNSAGLAADLGAVAERLGLHPKIAYIEGDDVSDRIGQWLADGVELRHLDTGDSLGELGVTPITANAYLGAWGIVQALRDGADVVICPRVTDASVVVGPAAWAFNWERDDWDALAGAVIAGHLLECGPQVCGGNYSFFTEIANPVRPGFPLVEIHPDGSSVITKHPGTPGQVSIGTVTAQLLYEVDRPHYLNPDVTAHFDSVTLREEGPDRVSLSGQNGSLPPDTLKVCINYHGGFRNSYTTYLTGLDLDQKARFAVDSVFTALGGRDQFDETDVRLIRSDRADAEVNSEAMAKLTITVKHHDGDAVGRRFAAAVNGIGLAIFPGNYNEIVSPQPTEFGVMWPTLVPAALIEPRVVIDGGEPLPVPWIAPGRAGSADPTGAAGDEAAAPAPKRRDWSSLPTTVAPLGRLFGARSGDKGGNANIGVWARSDDAYDWLLQMLTAERLHELLPETDGLVIDRYPFPNLRAVNFVVRGILDEGVAATTRPDAQAKSLCEFLRSRCMPLPDALLQAARADPPASASPDCAEAAATAS
jgi:Acyclic terpene utilisation family protein AtuA